MMKALGLTLLLLASGSTTAFASVIYEYREAGTNVLLGTLEVASPPASATSGWSTTNSSDLLALYVFGFGSGNLVTGNTVSIDITSLTGETLDAGFVSIVFPTIPGDPTIDQTLDLLFDSTAGGDRALGGTTSRYSDGTVIIGDLFLDGDFLVPEPGTLSLFALALLGAHRHRTRVRR